MKTRNKIDGATFWMHLCLVFVLSLLPCSSSESGAGPEITKIGLESNRVVVTAMAPAGIEKATLEGKNQAIGGAWTPLAVSHLNGQGGEVVFRIDPSKKMALLRIRGDASDPLPRSFYSGATSFDTALNGNTRSDAAAYSLTANSFATTAGLSWNADASIGLVDATMPTLIFEAFTGMPIEPGYAGTLPDYVFVEGDFVVLADAGKLSANGINTLSRDAFPTLSIAQATNPSQVTATYKLPGLPLLNATLRNHKLYVTQGKSSETLTVWSSPGSAWTTTNSRASLTMTILDMAKLPLVEQIGQTNIVFDEFRFFEGMTAVWPAEDLLVLAYSETAQSSLNILGWNGDIQFGLKSAAEPLVFSSGMPVGAFDILGDVVTGSMYVSNPNNAMFMIDGFSPVILPGISWGGNSGSTASERQLAFNVNDAATPRLVSDMVLATNVNLGGGQYFVSGNLVYSSHRDWQSKIVATNFITLTQYKTVQVTNTVVKTNIVNIPHYAPVTNVLYTTNVVVTETTSTETVQDQQTNYVSRRVLPWTSASTDASLRASLLAAGGLHNLAVKPDGSLWTWGDNWVGALGDGTRLSRRAPTPLAAPAGIQAVAGGAFYSLAVDEAKHLWSWGDNGFSQLGIGDPEQLPDMPPPLPSIYELEPVRVGGISNVIAVAASDYHSLALDGDGVVWAWGDNWLGSLGVPDKDASNQPIPVPSISHIASIAAGLDYSLAVGEDGALWAWGANANGQLGDGSAIDRFSPVRITAISDVKSVAAGAGHTLALKKDGSVWSWGLNSQGQLGCGNTNDSSQPVRISGLEHIVAVAAAGSHSMALDADGIVWSWGANEFGQAGDRTLQNRTTPVRALDLTGVSVIAAGKNHSLALRSSGEIWAWGDDSASQLGDGALTTFTNIDLVTRIVTITNAVPETNIVVATNIDLVLSYTTYRTNIVHITNVTTSLEPVAAEIPVPIYRSTMKYYLDVVDYSDPANPSLREKTELPGLLRGVFHDGAMLYTLGNKWDANGASGAESILAATAYDGVNAWLVDSLTLPSSSPQIWAHGKDVFISPARASANAEVQSVTLTNDGKFTNTGTITLNTSVSFMDGFGPLLAIQTSDRVISLFDSSDAGNPKALGTAQAGANAAYNPFQGAFGDVEQGLWIPLNGNSVQFIPAKP